MKKKVLPPFHHHYTPQEEVLIAACKKHFTALKLEGLVIIPFAFKVGAKQEVMAIQPSSITENPKLSFIEQFWQLGKEAVHQQSATCFAVCYDSHVFDAEEVDQDALVFMLKKEDGSQQQINMPYVVANEGLVFGETWLEDLGNRM